MRLSWSGLWKIRFHKHWLETALHAFAQEKDKKKQEDLEANAEKDLDVDPNFWEGDFSQWWRSAFLVMQSFGVASGCWCAGLCFGRCLVGDAPFPLCCWF